MKKDKAKAKNGLEQTKINEEERNDLKALKSASAKQKIMEGETGTEKTILYPFLFDQPKAAKRFHSATSSLERKSYMSTWSAELK